MSTYIPVKLTYEVNVPVKNKNVKFTKDDAIEVLENSPDVIYEGNIEIGKPIETKKFIITIRPFIEKYVEIDAVDQKHAISKLKQLWKDGKINYMIDDEIGDIDVLDIPAYIKEGKYGPDKYITEDWRDI